MAVLLGNEYLGWVESSVPATYNSIKGQGTLTINRSRPKIDTSSKETTGYSTGAFGPQDLSIDLDIKVTLPDANGYTRFETQCNAGVPFGFSVRKNGAAGVSADAVFTASVYGSIQSTTFNKDGTVDVKAQLALAAVPTVDALA